MRDLVPDDVLIDGRRIAAGVHGSGRPVVLLHGTPSFSLIWRDIVPRLTAAGYAVHLYDLLGYGYSERPQDPAVDTSVSAQVPLLMGLLDHWRLDRVDVIAHDIGGAIAARACLIHPGRWRSLAMMDCVSYDSWPSPRTRELIRDGLDQLLRATDAEHRARMNEWLLSAVYDEAALRAGPLAAYVEMLSGPVGQASQIQHQIRHYDERHTMEIAPRYSELGAIPVEIMWGAQDAWQNVAYAERLHADIPGSSLNIVPDAGHFLQEDQPERVAELLLAHLARAA